MIGVLNAYRFEPETPKYQLEYEPMCMDFFKRIDPHEKFVNYNFALGEEPKGVSDCSAWIITGSPRGVYDSDPWIVRLADFIRGCHGAKKKLVGICFGHQLIAHTLGGKTEKVINGWGVGVHTFPIISTKSWMIPEKKNVSLLFSHQDQVVKLPPGGELLGAGNFCPIQMFSINDHILGMQGHPEFTSAFARGRLDTRVASVGQEKYDDAIATIAQKTDADDVGHWIKNFIAAPIRK